MARLCREGWNDPLWDANTGAKWSAKATQTASRRGASRRATSPGRATGRAASKPRPARNSPLARTQSDASAPRLRPNGKTSRGNDTMVYHGTPPPARSSPPVKQKRVQTLVFADDGTLFVSAAPTRHRDSGVATANKARLARSRNGASPSPLPWQARHWLADEVAASDPTNGKVPRSGKASPAASTAGILARWRVLASCGADRIILWDVAKLLQP